MNIQILLILLLSSTLKLSAQIIDKGGMPPFAWDIICDRILEDQNLTSILRSLRTQTNQNDYIRVRKLSVEEFKSVREFLEGKGVKLDELGNVVYWTRVEPTFKTVLFQYRKPGVKSIVCILPLNAEWQLVPNIETHLPDFDLRFGIAQTFIRDDQKILPLTSLVADVQNKGYIEKYKLENSLPLVYIIVGKTNSVQVEYFLGNDRWVTFPYLNNGSIGGARFFQRSGRLLNYDDILKQAIEN